MVKLAFMHIPKTGGISVEHAVADGVPKNTPTCPAYFMYEYLRKTYADLSGFDIYQGHFDFDFMKSMPAEYTRAVVLRQPSDQVLSLCNHIASRPKHRLYQSAQGASLSVLLTSNPDQHNMMAQYLLGQQRYEEIIAGDTPKKQKIDLATSEILANIATFDVIGLTTRLNRFIRDIGSATGAQIPAPMKENANKFITYDAAKLTGKDKDALRNASWMDRPVYRAIWREVLDNVYKS